MRKLSVIGVLMAVLMMGCTKTDKAVCAKYADKEETDSLEDTLGAYDSAMIVFDKLDADMWETMSGMGNKGQV